MADINRVFRFLEYPKLGFDHLKEFRALMLCPTNMRDQLYELIDREVRFAKAKKPASIILKVNSLSDHDLITKLYEAAHEGVEIQMIVRGIFCAVTDNQKFKKPIRAISIVDEYLEHARVMIFNNGGKEKVFISSADWMLRNIDHRIEVAVPITDSKIINELRDIINIQLNDNVKARILDNQLSNRYVSSESSNEVRSQIEVYKYLCDKLSQKDKEALELAKEA